MAVELSGPVAHLNLNYKGAEGTCREADARNTRRFTPPIPSVEVSLYLQPTLPPGAGRGFGPSASAAAAAAAGGLGQCAVGRCGRRMRLNAMRFRWGRRRGEARERQFPFPSFSRALAYERW